MKNYQIIIAILFLLISSTISAQDELGSYLKVAAENNTELKSKFSEYMAALEIAPQVKALPDPQLAFAYFIQPVETRVGPQQFKFSASQLFPWFGTLKDKENVAIQQAKAKYEVFLESKSKLFNDVRSTYYNIYFNAKAIEITKENIQLLNTFKRLANIKIEAGLTSALDEYRIEMELGDLENQLALLIDQDGVLSIQFQKLLNSESKVVFNPTIQLDDINLNLSKEQVLDSILSKNHQLLTLSLQQEALSYQKSLAGNNGKPSFLVGFDYTVVGKGDNNLAGTDAFVFPKIGISIPLYRTKYKAMVNEVLHLQSAKEFEIENKENLLSVVLENGWKNYSDADRRIQLYKSQSALAELSLNLLETEYSTGNMSFEEILRMERKLLKYKLEAEKAIADKQAAIAFIHYLMGR
ncbi:MAG: TolC family protein [Prolixibacteraceae bacterium]|jgi:cobalt-zinc-cadmium efflux system outer membrane protein|nr:TolC family protein [Prolixibacteraceae bacterium]